MPLSCFLGPCLEVADEWLGRGRGAAEQVRGMGVRVRMRREGFVEELVRLEP